MIKTSSIRMELPDDHTKHGGAWLDSADLNNWGMAMGFRFWPQWHSHYVLKRDQDHYVFVMIQNPEVVEDLEKDGWEVVSKFTPEEFGKKEQEDDPQSS